MSFDIASLRTFVAITDSGSFQAAALRVNRSVSAVSQQMEKISQVIGKPIFERQGRRMVLSTTGHAFLPYARSMIAEEDAALMHLQATTARTIIRFGCVQDFSQHLLQTVLETFIAHHSTTQLEIEVSSSSDLAVKVAEGKLDLALHEVTAGKGKIPVQFSTPMIWVGRRGWPQPQESLPLALFTQGCPFRVAALTALESARRQSHIAFTSPSLSGLKASVLAGLGVTVRTKFLLDEGLQDISVSHQLPKLPAISYGMNFSNQNPEPRVSDLAEMVRATLKSKFDL